MKHIYQWISIIWVVFLIVSGCDSAQSLKNMGESVGQGENVTERQADDGLVETLVRELGAHEVEVLLNSPSDPENPGLPIEHILYLLDNIPQETLIHFLQNTGAEKTLKLVYSIKRLGCNRPTAENPYGRFDIPFTHRYTDCTLEDYPYLDKVSVLMNQVNDFSSLISVVNQVGLDSESITARIIAVSDEQYLEKIAYLVVYSGQLEKLVSVINNAQDPRDIVSLVSWIQAVETSLTQTNKTAGTGNQSLANLTTLINLVDPPEKLLVLINGKRMLLETDDFAQSLYLSHLIPVIEGPSAENSPGDCDDSAGKWPETIATLINKTQNIKQMVYLLDQMNSGSLAHLISLVCHISSESSDTEVDAALGMLAELIENTGSMDKLAGVLQADPLKLSRLLGLLSADNTGGKSSVKLSSLLSQVTRIQDLVYVVNTTYSTEQIAGLILKLDETQISKVADLINNMTGSVSPLQYLSPVYYDQRMNATGLGKLVNLLDYTINVQTCQNQGSELYKLIAGISDIPRKLAPLINDVTNSFQLAAFLNGILITDSEADATLDDLLVLLNSLNYADMAKLSAVMNQLGDAEKHTQCGFSIPFANDRHQMVVRLMAPASGVNQGAGAKNISTLLSQLPDKNAVGGLITMLGNFTSSKQQNKRWIYNSSIPVISGREALVRIIQPVEGAGGVLLSAASSNPSGKDLLFPGLGPQYLAKSVLPYPAEISSLVSLINQFNLVDVLALAGCQDRVENSEVSFRQACCAIGKWSNTAQCQ
ncbi:MAG: hypothetical protein HQM12_06625 [SAR324 cluster bacterium]|nr:hypothetical protein [SAR324 cluster bacterium]